jgi:hypothetical protein
VKHFMLFSVCCMNPNDKTICNWKLQNYKVLCSVPKLTWTKSRASVLFVLKPSNNLYMITKQKWDRRRENVQKWCSTLFSPKEQLTKSRATFWSVLNLQNNIYIVTEQIQDRPERTAVWLTRYTCLCGIKQTYHHQTHRRATHDQLIQPFQH